MAESFPLTISPPKDVINNPQTRCRRSLHAVLIAMGWGIRMALGCIFIFSSLPKIIHPYDFLHAVYGYEILSPTVGAIFAAVLPWLELSIALALVLGIYRFVAASLVVALGILFLIAESSVIGRNMHIPCGCFGATDMHQMVDASTMIRAIGIATLAFLNLAIEYAIQRAAGRRNQQKLSSPQGAFSA